MVSKGSGFKKKAAFLSVLVAALALAYILTFVFDPQRQSRGSFSWLDLGAAALADSIEINGSNGKTVLNLRNKLWVFTAGTALYPVKQGRVDDLLAVLSRRDLYPLRSVSQEGRDRLGFAEGKSSRIVIRGGAGLPLLDLLIGTGDVLGRDVYLKRADQDEIYSGEDRFTIFTDSKPNAWYDLRLFPADNQSAPGRGGAAAPAASGAYSINAGQVQEAEISLPRSNGEGGAPAPQGTFVLRRDSRGWIIPGNEGAALDTTKVESWLRAVLEAEGEDFSSEAPAAVDGHITLRLGDGTVRTIQAGPADSDKRRNITVSGSKLVYVFSEWPFSRLFREQTYFLKAANR